MRAGRGDLSFVHDHYLGYVQCRRHLWLRHAAGLQSGAALRQRAVLLRRYLLPNGLLQRHELRSTFGAAMRYQRQQLLRLLTHPGEQLLLLG